MKIQYLSDLHIEYQLFRFEQCDADVVVLAGDIHIADRGLERASRNIPQIPIIYVSGNHEYYGHSFPSLCEWISQKTSFHISTF